MTASTMTPRQRWLALINREQPDRIPTDYWTTGEFHAKLKKHLGISDDEQLWRTLHIDRPHAIGPSHKGGGHHPNDSQADIWGVRYESIEYGTGSYSEAAHRPLAQFTSVEQVHAYRWPSPNDFDYSPVATSLASYDGYRPIRGGAFEPFLLYAYLRGLEQSFEDLLLAPDLAHAILGHIFDFYYEYNRRTFEAGQGKIDIFYLAEDLGSQSSALMSLELYRQFLLPNQKKMADLARAYGVHIVYHTDGAAHIFLPDLVNVVGIEILNPIQWRCPGMERETLAREWGKKIVFYGAIDNQQTLPFGSVADVVQEVRETAEIFRNCRWICAPCHNLQAVSPPENVVALYQTIHELSLQRA